jgi:hypothetical protein
VHLLLGSLLACSAPMAATVDEVETLDVGDSVDAALPVPVPDPEGRTVILELVRSVDW